MEHSKSARYNRKKNSNNMPRLWDPNDPRLLALSRRQQYERSRVDGSRSPSPSLGNFLLIWKLNALFIAPSLAAHERPCVTGMTRHHKMILQKIWMRALDSDKQEMSQNSLSHLLRSNSQLYQIFNLVSFRLNILDQKIFSQNSIIS